MNHFGGLVMTLNHGLINSFSPLTSGGNKWQKISHPENITEILKQVYKDHSTDVDKLFSRIVEITQHPAASASFASIMFAPGGELSFSEALSRCKKNNVQICLMYGKKDPWVGPIWRKKIKKELPNAPYYEINPAGHCPHDEVPEGKRLNPLSLKELQHLEKQLNFSPVSVRERKIKVIGFQELMLTKQLEESRLKEQRAELENETLRRQVSATTLLSFVLNCLLSHDISFSDF
ncbi:unnamed protein product [Eruca vesicaria subsp. sativa]|uniref:K-box domain-containing protein n=1 Tax=Eruca vesicaria subsp. sativa TaxID=29727 RepID=A0ABC8J795_ERUVS|nr:unnamed protein product [Eruca vesicaria subsp. sativa]